MERRATHHFPEGTLKCFPSSLSGLTGVRGRGRDVDTDEINLSHKSHAEERNSGTYLYLRFLSVLMLS
jgi:hypothetical protein